MIRPAPHPSASAPCHPSGVHHEDLGENLISPTVVNGVGWGSGVNEVVTRIVRHRTAAATGIASSWRSCRSAPCWAGDVLRWWGVGRKRGRPSGSKDTRSGARSRRVESCPPIVVGCAPRPPGVGKTPSGVGRAISHSGIYPDLNQFRPHTFAVTEFDRRRRRPTRTATPDPLRRVAAPPRFAPNQWCACSSGARCGKRREESPGVRRTRASRSCTC